MFNSRYSTIIVLFLGSSLCVFFLNAFTAGDRTSIALTTMKPSTGFAVVELFTSQGCSSCPPADEALIDLIERSRKQGDAVYALSFHVDYWNRLGWKDPFSSAKWSDRQRNYAERLPGGVYTPECVVNGSKAFVGSDKEKLAQAVSSALKEPTNVGLSVGVEQHGNVISVRVTTTDAPIGTELVACLVEDGLSTVVKRGENGGHTLHHAHVVRSFVSAPLTGGAVLLELGMDGVVDRANASVVVFAQAANQGVILGASQAVLPALAR